MCCSRTNPEKKRSKNGIDHQVVTPLCRLCKEKIERVFPVVSSCSVLAGNQ